MSDQVYVVTTIRVKAPAWEALRRIAAIKAAQRGERRVSVSREVSDMATAELARLDAASARRVSRAS